MAAHFVRSIDELGDSLGATIAYQMRSVFHIFLRSQEATSREGVWQFITGEEHPMGNMAFFSKGASEFDVKDVISEFDRNGLPCAVLLLDDEVSGLDAHLLESGFQFEAATPTMACDLSRLQTARLADGYEFELLENGRASESWSRALAEGYELPASLTNWFSPESVEKVDLEEAEYLTYRVSKGGETVATSQMLLKDGLAGIYCVSTLANERGKGLGAYMTYEPLRIARERGFSVGVLQSSGIGKSVYERLGFKTNGEIKMALRMPA